MAFTFIREVWAPVLLDNLYKDYVFAAPGVVNRDYEGDAQLGGSVHITSMVDVAVADYAVGTALTYAELETTQQSLLINQSKYFANKLDDLNRKQAVDAQAVIAKAMVSASAELSDAADAYVASLYAGADSANVLAATDVHSDPTLIYPILVGARTALNKSNTPKADRYAIVSPDVSGFLLQDQRFINASAAGDQGAALHNGLLGSIAGFQVYESNNAPSSAAKHSTVCFGHPSAITFADQIQEMEQIRLQTTFGDGLRGLHVYGAKLTRPKSIGSVDLTISA